MEIEPNTEDAAGSSANSKPAANPPVAPNDPIHNAQGAIVKVAGLLPQLASAAAAITGLGLYMGWQLTSSYYRVLGAPWFASTLPPAVLLENALPLMFVLSLGALFSVTQAGQGISSAKYIRRAFVVVGVIVVGLIVCGMALPKVGLPGAARICASLSNYGFLIFGGIYVGDLVQNLAESKLEWRSSHTWILFSLCSYGFMQGPQSVGSDRASSDISITESRLPLVSLKSFPQEKAWRLVSTAGSQLLLVMPAEKADDVSFRIVDASEAIQIRTPSASAPEKPAAAH